jgi:hypothetical protein
MGRAEQEFDCCYAIVDKCLDEYVKSIRAPADRDWFQRLQSAFRIERNKWPSSDEVKPALQEAGRLPNAPLRIAVLAYMHICYDLPRVIAPTLQGLSAKTLERRRQVYLQADGAILEAFRAALQRADIVGRGWCWPIRLARLRFVQNCFGPIGDMALSGFGDSVIRKRWMAWDNAVSILEEPGFEACLGNHLRKFFAETIKDKKIYMGLPRLLPGYLAWVSDRMNYSKRPEAIIYEDCYYTIYREPDPFFEFDSFSE